MPAAVSMPHTQAGTPYRGELADLLHRLASCPCLQIERCPDGVTFRVRDLVVGRLDFRTHVLSVNVPPDRVPLLLAVHPLLVGTKDSVSLRVSDIDSRTAAEASLRWRIGLERFAHQLRAASP